MNEAHLMTKNNHFMIFVIFLYFVLHYKKYIC